MKIRIKTGEIEWECEGEPVAYDDITSGMRSYHDAGGPKRETFHHQKGVVECHRLFLEFLAEKDKPRADGRKPVPFDKLPDPPDEDVTDHETLVGETR